MAKAIGESIKPALEKLVRVLKTGEVPATVRVKM
jgi:hypothetical protein